MLIMNTNFIQTGESKGVFLSHVEQERFKLEANAQLQLVILSNASLKKREVEIYLTGENSRISVFAFIYGQKSDDFNLKIKIFHEANHCKSRIETRSVLFDSARVNFEGIIKIPNEGEFADTYLNHKGLLLSDKAKCRSIPSLEVLASQVKAGHSAAIGKMDENLLFYMLSRGLSKNEAIKMYTEGFLLALTEMIENEKLREQTIVSLNKTIYGPSKENSK
jgi:Fe-S cluster assembly protein SufD